MGELARGGAVVVARVRRRAAVVRGARVVLLRMDHARKGGCNSHHERGATDATLHPRIFPPPSALAQ